MDNTDNPSGFSESFILGIIGAVGGLITIVFASMRKSRCGDINCCWGMFSCKREVLTKEELELEPPTPPSGVPPPHNRV